MTICGYIAAYVLLQDERQLQGSDEHPTVECAQCTSVEFQFPLQDESSNVPLSENLLHSSVRYVATNIAISYIAT